MHPLGLVGVLALLALAPIASACDGLSPGDQFLTEGVSCTLGFIVANHQGLYFSTAGHCIHENSTASSPGVGDFGVGVFHHLVPETGSESDGYPGDDFALIRIDPAVYDKLNPKICGWNGPTGLYDDAPGSGGVKHFGHGLVLGEFAATQPRQGFNLENDNTAFFWSGAGVPGDSGSAVIADDGRALGVLTHLIVRPPDTNGGTHLTRGFALAADAKGIYGLRLVLMDENPVEVLRELQGQPQPATPTTSGPTTPPPSRPPVTSPTPPPASNGSQTRNGTSDNLTPAGGGSRPSDTPGAVHDPGANPTPGVPTAILLAAVAALVVARRRRT